MGPINASVKEADRRGVADRPNRPLGQVFDPIALFAARLDREEAGIVTRATQLADPAGCEQQELDAGTGSEDRHHDLLWEEQKAIASSDVRTNALGSAPHLLEAVSAPDLP